MAMYITALSTRTNTIAAIQNMNLNKSAWSLAIGPAVPNVDWLLSGVHAASRTIASGTKSISAVRIGKESFETRCIWELYVACGGVVNELSQKNTDD